MFGVTLISALLASLFSLGPATAYPRPGNTIWVSHGLGMTPADLGAGITSMSSDGRYILYFSTASNHVEGDTNGKRDIFLYDRETQKTELVSLTDDARLSDNDVGPDAFISADGRYVAFTSIATNLVPNDRNGFGDVFVRDRVAGTTELVSLSTSGAQGADHFSIARDMSADGRYVLFESQASNFVPNDTNQKPDLFIRDRQTNTTIRVTNAMGGGDANGSSLFGQLSDDGNFVTFLSFASNLVPGDANNIPDVFLHDRLSNQTEKVSQTPEGKPANQSSGIPSISADGRYVAYSSIASNLVPEDQSFIAPDRLGDLTTDAFVWDRLTRRTERVSVAYDGQEPNGESATFDAPVLSGDGRYVMFDSRATNLVPDDANGKMDIFLHDRHSGVTERVSLGADGAEANNTTFDAAMSDDARIIGFHSLATNIIPGASAGSPGTVVYARDRGPNLGLLDATVERTSNGLTISGRATFSPVVVGQQADPLGDATRDGGGDLIGATVTQIPESSLLHAELELANIPGFEPPEYAPTPGVARPPIIYGVSFIIEGRRYEVRGTPLGLGTVPRISIGQTAQVDTAQRFIFFRCAPTCTRNGSVAGSLGRTGRQMVADIPFATFGEEMGGTITDVKAFTALGTEDTGMAEIIDEINLGEGEIGPPVVKVGLAKPGTPPNDIQFNDTAAFQDGSFNFIFDPFELDGDDQTAWVQLCTGACRAAFPITEEGSDPDPSATPSPTVSTTSEPTETPSPSPTESPQPETTTVAFTADSRTSGQYSDQTHFQARLVDFNDEPIAGAELTFELAGEKWSRRFTAITDEGGIASVSPILEEKPGPHQLTVRYAGNDSHQGSADTTSFVVDKEDTATEFTVSGKGSKRRLEARLADADAPSSGIAGASIAFYSDDEFLGTALTDQDGVATFDPKGKHQGGDHTYEARFEGDDYYHPSSDTSDN